MSEICRLVSGDRMIDKCDIVTVFLGFPLETFKYHRKILVAQPRTFFSKQYAEIIGPVRLESSGRDVGRIAQLLRNFSHLLLRGSRNIRLIIQSF